MTTNDLSPLGKPARPSRPRNFDVSSSEAIVLDVVRRQREVSRADLTRSTGLTKQSVGRIVDALVERDFLTFGETIINGPGKPSTLIRLVPESAYTVGISISSDSMVGVLMKFDGQCVETIYSPIEGRSTNELLTLIEETCRQLMSIRSLEKWKICGVGLAVSGYFTSQDHRVNPPEPLQGLASIDVDKEIADRLLLPVWIENDANAAAIGENLNGVGLTIKNFAYIHHTYGLGGAIVINNQLVRGFYGNAGEFSGILAPDLLEHRPTLELLRRKIENRGHSLSNIEEMLSDFDINWPGIEDWLDIVAEPASRIITSIASVIDPQAIVLGGYVPKSLANLLRDRVKIFEGKKRLGRHQPRPEILVSAVEGDATALGAASIPLKASFYV